MTTETNPFLSVAFDNDADPFPNNSENLTGDKRTEARLCAVQALTQYIVTSEDISAIRQEFTAQTLKTRNADKKIFTAILTCVADDTPRFEAMLQAEFPAGRTWADANPVHKALLLAALGEWHSSLTTPPKTVLNEFLNISKGFCPPEETAFLNGVLNSVLKKLLLV